MKPNLIPVLLGFIVGIVLALGATYAAYRGNLVPAIIMVVCQIVAFAAFVFALLSKRARASVSSDS